MKTIFDVPIKVIGNESFVSLADYERVAENLSEALAFALAFVPISNPVSETINKLEKAATIYPYSNEKF
jgi:hypothetical protein